MGGYAHAPSTTKLSRKATTAMSAIAELHIVLNCPNETAFINTIRSSSVINFPFPLQLVRYFYRVYLIEHPCIVCARSKMTKPDNFYLQPSTKRQLCVDVAWFLSHHGLVPVLVMIDTVEEHATCHELPLKYTGEDVLRCIVDRLNLDRSKEVEVEEIVSDPESTIGRAFELLKEHNKYSHVVALEVPTKTHVSIVESFINKLRIRLRAVASQFQIQYGVRLPLQFVIKMLPNIVRKLNYVSNLGSLHMIAPALQRGEEPLDYEALVSLKIGDIVLAYHTGDETRTKAVFTVVLDHEFHGSNPNITAGFNLETPMNTSAGNLSIAKYKKIKHDSVPPFIIEKLKEIEKKGQLEAAATIKAARKRKEKLSKLIAKCDDQIKKLELEIKLKESPPELEEVLATVRDSEAFPVTTDAPNMPSTQGGDTSLVQGGEENKTTLETPTESINQAAPNDSTTASTVESTTTNNNNNSSTVASVDATAANDNKTVAPSKSPYSLRRNRKKSYKLESHLILHDLNQLSEDEKDWNLYVMLNLKHQKGQALEEFLSLHTSISDALKEDEPKVKEAIIKEWDQVLEPAKHGDKEVLKCMSKNFNPYGKSVIPCMMFMKKKMNKVTKQLEKWKARLAAGGHMQDADLYPKKDITVPTLDHSALLTFLSSMMKRKGVRFHAMDFPGAYLSADLETEIYMTINKQNTDILVEHKPELKEYVRDNGTIITKIQKALYGLKEAGKLFRDKLVNLFDDFGLKEIPSNKCIFKKELSNGKTFFVCVYVDDVIIATDDEDTRIAFLKHCQKEFPDISMNSDDAFSFLGMAISFDYNKKLINYDNALYIQELADTYNINEESFMPFNQNFMSHDSQDVYMDNVRKYKSLVMSLFYVAKRTRPDILFAVSYLATHCSEPTEPLYEKAKKLLSYLKTTKNLKLTHKCDNDGPKKLLFTFIDASYAIHKDMKGHSGCLIFDESGNLLYASSTKQKLMSKSSTDAEIIAVHSSMNTIEEMRDLFNYLNDSNDSVCLYQDNLSAKFLMEHGDSSSDKSKHMKVRYFYIKEKVDDDIINIQYRDTKRMWADLLTKPITNKNNFYACRSILMNCQEGDKYYVI